MRGRATWIVCCLVLGVGSIARADPMRLADPTPRWVVVQFEDSPSERPDLLDRVYTKPFAGWLERNEQGQVVVRVGGDVLEQNLFRENNPVPGSFSDYVWVFDPDTGEVLSASFSGTFAYVIDWGFTTSQIRARVRARMETTGTGGYRGAENLWGRALYPFCEDVGSARCTAVPARPYDGERGYVNAVGYLAIDSPLTQFSTYSAVGEARFSEIDSSLHVNPPVRDVTVSATVVGVPVSAETEARSVSSGPPAF